MKEQGSMTRTFFTPQLAAQWLSESGGNRPISKASIGALVRALQAAKAAGRDDGIYTPNPVVKDSRGKTVDGHHRLTAIVASGIGSWLNAQHGFDDVLRLDLGMARNIGAQAHFAGDSVAKMRRASEILNALRTVARQSGARSNYEDVSRFIVLGGAAAEWAIGLSRVQVPAFAAAAGMMVYPIDATRVTELFAQATMPDPDTAHASVLAHVLRESRMAARSGGSRIESHYTRVLSIAKRWLCSESCIVAHPWPGAIADIDKRRVAAGALPMLEFVAKVRDA